MSPAEVALWNQLRQRPLGLKFRRQHPVGPYSGDFYCASAKLIIEVDGEAHNMGDRPARDERRDEYLGKLGYMTLRIPARDVFRNSSAAADPLTLYAAANPLHHPPTPSAPADGPPPRPGEDKETE